MLGEIKPTGKCDICNTKDAVAWFGATSAAICDKELCQIEMKERYSRHCEKMEAEIAFEKEMREIYGCED